MTNIIVSLFHFILHFTPLNREAMTSDLYLSLIIVFFVSLDKCGFVAPPMILNKVWIFLMEQNESMWRCFQDGVSRTAPSEGPTVGAAPSCSVLLDPLGFCDVNLLHCVWASVPTLLNIPPLRCFQGSSSASPPPAASTGLPNKPQVSPHLAALTAPFQSAKGGDISTWIRKGR